MSKEQAYANSHGDAGAAAPALPDVNAETFADSLTARVAMLIPMGL